MKKRRVDFLALLLAILVGFGNVYNIFLNFLHTPPGTAYLGTGVFYLLDYLNYLAEIGQGLRGNWQLFNLYTQESTVGYWVISWPYLVIGHLCRLFSLSAPVGYWLSVFCLTSAIAFGAYLFLKKVLKTMEKSYLLLPIFLVYLVASPFFVLQKNPLRLEFWRLTWYYQTDFFERESVLPHHLVSNLGVIFFFLSSVAFFESLRKKQFLRPAMLAAVCLSLSLGLVMSVNPIKLTYLLPALGVTFIYGLFFYRFFNLKKVLIYAILLAALVSFLFLFGLYFQKNVAVTYYPEVVAWEKSAMQWPDLGHFLLASGVVLVLAVPALLILLRDILKVALHPSILLGILASIFSYILFYTPFSLMFNNHNSRLLFPDAYLFMAIMIFLALDKVKKEFWQKKTLVWLLTVLLVYFSLPSVYLALNHRSLENADFKQDYFKYLPNEIGEGLQYLDSQAVDRPLVLTTTIAGMGMLVPIYAQVHVYTARELVTVDFTPKAIKGNNFFTNVMSIQEKINFLRQEKINFLVYSIYDLAGMDKKYLQQPFWLFKDLPLKLIFANSKIVIYKVLE